MSEDGPFNSKDCKNLYELIMVAAKEARRLNDYYRNRNVQPKERVTSVAIKRARGDGILYTYHLPEPAESEEKS